MKFFKTSSSFSATATSTKIVVSEKRFYTLLAFLIIGVTILALRIGQLMIWDRNFLLHQGMERSVRIHVFPANRGMIVDRNGQPLAVSTKVDAVWANPVDFSIKSPQMERLCQLLKLDKATLIQQISHQPQREFIYLKRGINSTLGSVIQGLHIPGVYVQHEFRRYYPENEVSAHLLGFTNIDDHGQEGLELAYNNWLTGVPGKQLVQKDRLGHIVAGLKVVQKPRPGHDLILSIDRRIQYLAYQALKHEIETSQANAGSALVLDAKTGEVLAVVNEPTFNPNARYRVGGGDAYRNRAFTDLFEPGSVIKAFSVANALSGGQYTPNSIVDTSPGWLRVGKNIVRDKHNYGPITVTQILQRSSNVGVSKLTLSLPSPQLIHLLKNLEFGKSTHSGFPGESPGTFHIKDIKPPFGIAALAFGYGIAVTPLQLAHAYSVFANSGRLLPISLLRLNKLPQGEVIFKESLVTNMLNMLEAVVAGSDYGATGKLAQVPGYRVAGKTGTSRVLGKNGYEEHRHIASFVAIAPVSNPRFVVAVVIQEPKANGTYYANFIAAPVAAEILAGALRIYNIPPDNLASLLPDNVENKSEKSTQAIKD